MRTEKAKERIGEIENKIMENNEAEKKWESKQLYHKGRIRELSVSMKSNNICIIGEPEEEEQEKGAEGLFEKKYIAALNASGDRRKQAFKSKRHRELPLKINKNRGTP